MLKSAMLTCYDISSDSERLSRVDNFCEEIKTVILNSESVAARIRYLSDLKEEGESQFVSNFKICNEGLFCSFLHMENGSGINISKTLLNAKEFDLEEATAETAVNITGHIKESTYFFMTDKYLILKNTRTISKDDIAIYLNYLLENMTEKYRGKSHPLFLKYHIKKSFDVTQIKSFELLDGYKINKDSIISTVSKSISLDSIFSAVDMNGLSVDDVLSASIVFKIRKMPKDKKVESAKIAQAIFDGFNTDNVKFMGKNNTPLSVTDAKTTKAISLKFSNNSRYPDKDSLRQNMIDFVKEVENESDS